MNWIPRNWKTLIVFSVSLFFVRPASRADEPRPLDIASAKTTVEAAASTPSRDTAVQGEYEGEVLAGGTKFPIGVRILALGDGRFRSIAYVGGLPGSGEVGGRQIVTESKWADDGTVTFKSDRSVTVWRDGSVHAQLGDREFEFKRVERRSPTLGKKPPKKALVLFAGKSLKHWRNGKLNANCLRAGATTVASFGSFTMHLEFQVPLELERPPSARGNSGLVIQDQYELQILDSFGLKSKHNECGGLVDIKRPDANMSSPAGAWQTFDLEFTQQKVSAQHELLDPPLITIRHNGVYIHKNVELPVVEDLRTRRHPLRLEGGDSPVLFRNIWIVAGS